MNTNCLYEAPHRNVLAVAATERPALLTPGMPHRLVIEGKQVRSWSGDYRGHFIRVSEGTVWVTQEGDSTDFVVKAGQSFRVTRPGRIVIESLSPSAELTFAASSLYSPI